MTSRQPLRSAVAFLALAAHNAEEALYARNWALANAEVITRYIGKGAAEIWAGSGFRLSQLGLTLALAALAVLAARAPQRGVAIYVLLGVLAVFAANALFPHVAGALALRAWVPGLATAVLLVLPVSAWVWVSTLREGYATRRGAVVAATVGLVLYAAVVSVAVRHLGSAPHPAGRARHGVTIGEWDSSDATPGLASRMNPMTTGER